MPTREHLYCLPCAPTDHPCGLLRLDIGGWVLMKDLAQTHGCSVDELFRVLLATQRGYFEFAAYRLLDVALGERWPPPALVRGHRGADMQQGIHHMRRWCLFVRSTFWEKAHVIAYVIPRMGRPSLGKVLARAAVVVLSTLPRMGKRDLPTRGLIGPYRCLGTATPPTGLRAHRLVFLKQDPNDVWTTEAQEEIIRVMTQDGIFPTQRVPIIRHRADRSCQHDGRQTPPPRPLGLPIHRRGGGEHDSMFGAGLPATDRGPQVHGTPR